MTRARLCVVVVQCVTLAVLLHALSLRVAEVSFGHHVHTMASAVWQALAGFCLADARGAAYVLRDTIGTMVAIESKREPTYLSAWRRVSSSARHMQARRTCCLRSAMSVVRTRHESTTTTVFLCDDRSVGADKLATLDPLVLNLLVLIGVSLLIALAVMKRTPGTANSSTSSRPTGTRTSTSDTVLGPAQQQQQRLAVQVSKTHSDTSCQMECSFDARERKIEGELKLRVGSRLQALRFSLESEQLATNTVDGDDTESDE